MSASLPLVRPFDRPYEAWSQREATQEEAIASMAAGNISLWVNETLIARITNECEAAEHMARQAIDNGLECHIDRALAADIGFRQWLRAMPDAMPPALDDYQQSYPPDDFGPADCAIHAHGAALSQGQLLFHGGFLCFPPHGTLVMTRPLSTTFCPQVALRSAEWMGKAYNAGQVDLYLLRVASPNTKAFVFDPQGLSEKRHEKEVLFSSGTTLILRSRREVRGNYEVWRMTENFHLSSKKVPIYLCEVDLF